MKQVLKKKRINFKDWQFFNSYFIDNRLLFFLYFYKSRFFFHFHVVNGQINKKIHKYHFHSLKIIVAKESVMRKKNDKWLHNEIIFFSVDYETTIVIFLDKEKRLTCVRKDKKMRIRALYNTEFMSSFKLISVSPADVFFLFLQT